MEISACFSEILTQVDLLIKKQKEQINNAIDIPNWGEAQNVIKQAYENTSALKTLKEKAVQLQQEFENTGLFTEEAGAGTEEQPGSVEKSIPVKKTILLLLRIFLRKKKRIKMNRIFHLLLSWFPQLGKQLNQRKNLFREQNHSSLQFQMRI